MSTHVSETSVREWLDDTAINDGDRHTDEETRIYYQAELSQFSVHVIKESSSMPAIATITLCQSRSSTVQQE